MAHNSTVFILHGWSVSEQNEAKWADFRAELERLGVQSKFLPIPGLSSPLEEVWELDDFAQWLAGELSDEPVVLLGHSFGGQIAVRFARQHPERVSRLILIDSAGIRDHSLLPTLKRFVFLQAAKVGKLFFHSAFLRTLMYRLAREGDYATAPPLLRRTMSNILDDEVIADLPHISQETLLIWGEQDRVTPLHLADQFVQALPHATLQIIPDARHSPQFSHVNQAVSLVAAFVQAGSTQKAQNG